MTQLLEKMKHLFINPHKSDFVFKSPVYQLIKRKNLGKYKYLSSYFNADNTNFLFLTSTLYSRFNKIRLGFLDKIILRIESYFFKRINNSKHDIQYKIKDKYEITFCFGFAIRDINIDQFSLLSSNTNNLIIHLSHYHLFADKLKKWATYSNVIFCADADIRGNFFYKYYNNLESPFFILPYCIDSRFITIKDWQSRKTKVISTGTFHEFEKTFTSKKLIKNSLSGDFGFLALHPERRIINLLKKQLPHVVCLNSPMGKSSIFSFAFKTKNISQKKYFSFDIVHEYNEYKFSFIGEESVSGLPGIGVFESIACGCIPIIKKGLYKGTPIEDHKIYLEYSSIEDLLEIFNNYEMLSSYSFKNEYYLELMEKVKTFYSSDFQLNCFTKKIDDILSNPNL